MQRSRALRKVCWGYSPADVRHVEDGVLVESTGSDLMYEVDLLGYKATLLYGFYRGQLVRGCYVVDDVDDIKDAIAHNTIRESLTRKYGPPRSTAKWRDHRYDRWPTSWQALANAIAIGELSLTDEWESGDTRIDLFLGSDEGSYGAHVILDYVNAEYDDHAFKRFVDDRLDML